MEHRYSARVDTALHAVLIRQNVPLALGRITDISHTGLFVETDCSDVKPLQYLDIRIPESDRRDGGHRYTAQVVRCGRSGYGLEIERAHTRAGKRALDQLVDEAGYQATQPATDPAREQRA